MSGELLNSLTHSLSRKYTLSAGRFWHSLPLFPGGLLRSLRSSWVSDRQRLHDLVAASWEVGGSDGLKPTARGSACGRPDAAFARDQQTLLLTSGCDKVLKPSFAELTAAERRWSLLNVGLSEFHSKSTRECFRCK